MNFIVNVLIIAVLSLVILTSKSFAQTSFSGQYKFAAREHVKGPEYGNGVPTSVTIEQTKDSVVMYHGSMDDNNQETKNRIAFASNGKPVSTVSKTSGRKLVRSLKWSDDKKTFTTTTDIYKEGADNEIELTRIDDYTLSPDAKHLLLHRRSVETITESWEDNATYDRQ
jgi:hypothetical protein